MVNYGNTIVKIKNAGILKGIFPLKYESASKHPLAIANDDLREEPYEELWNSKRRRKKHHSKINFTSTKKILKLFLKLFLLTQNFVKNLLKVKLIRLQKIKLGF